MTERGRAIVWSVVLIIALVFAGSWFFQIAYLYTLIGLMVWAAFGHLATLDDDAPDGWSNPGGDKSFWKSSLRSVALKFFLLVFLVWLAAVFPALRNFGV